MKCGYVALIGRPNVGKSTLLNNLLGRKVSIISDKPQTTRINILGIKTTPRGQIIFVDTPGIHRPLHKLNKRMMDFVEYTLETAELICLLIDATQSFGHGDAFVIDLLKKISTPKFLLINKIDLIKKESLLPLIDRYRELLEFKEIIPISALRGTNLPLLEEKIYEYLPESEKLYDDDSISVQSQKFLIAEIIREKILHHVRDELPYVTAVYVEHIDQESQASTLKTGELPQSSSPEKKITHIRATIFVEKENHRKIIIGRRGQMIKTIGMQARQELEFILGTKIFLELRVKVKEKWRDSPNLLDLIEQQ
ncbi:MAG: GTPase Era [Candidatus Aminicenantes bacterium]|nr:GTPase Era [Candidatus Aminicenantes bacterium]OQX53032.1 MAG: GTPase Era [Candidatus Aminicenantes bacterium 4484_214]RLE02334.1 MAG: GTPase Era [Candidatus Aminicenantes bacterium]